MAVKVIELALPYQPRKCSKTKHEGKEKKGKRIPPFRYDLHKNDTENNTPVRFLDAHMLPKVQKGRMFMTFKNPGFHWRGKERDRNGP